MKKMKQLYSRPADTISRGFCIDNKGGIMGDAKIPAGCKIGASYYGGMGSGIMIYGEKAKAAAEACAKAVGGVVKREVTNASDGLPAYIPEIWYNVISGKK